MDSRLKRVEFQPISLLTEAQIQNAVDTGDALEGRDAIVSTGAPNSYRRIFDGFVYSDKANGGDTGTTVELWVEAKVGAQVGDTIEVDGLRRADSKDLVASGKFKLLELDDEPWEGRDSWRIATPPSNVEEALYYRISSAAPDSWTTRRQFQTKRQISKYSATTTTVTLTMNSAHNFKEKDIISVDLESVDIRLFGVDGLFRVKSVTSTTIVYDFDTPIEEPINEATLTVPYFVYPVVREFIREGATWIQDGTEEGDIVWVWKDYRWVNLKDFTGDDGVPPAPVTNLTAISRGNKEAGFQTGTAVIRLNWTAPTKDAKNKNLVDLAGYEIHFRQYQTDEWKKEGFVGNDTTWVGTGFEDGIPAYFLVHAKDSGGLKSTPTAISHTPNLPADLSVRSPSPPTVTTYLGATRVEWNGRDFQNAISTANTFQIELHWSPVNGFSPSSSTLYERFPAIAGGAYLVIPNSEFGTINLSAPEGTIQSVTVYFKFIAVDVFGKLTGASIQTVATVQLSKIINFAELDVGSFVGKSITGATYQTNINVSTTGGIQFTKDFFVAYGGGGNETFRINATNGAVTIGGGLALSALNTLNDSITDPTTGLAPTRALAVSANGLIATATGKADSALAILTAQGLTLTSTNVTSGLEDITEITAGGLRLTRGKIIGSLNDSISSSTTTINGGVITTGTLNANRIGAGVINAGVITVTNLNATNINNGILSGRQVETGSSGGRIVLNPTSRRIDIFRTAGSSSTLAGTLLATSNGVRLDSSESDSSLTISPGAAILAGSNFTRLSMASDGELNVAQPTRANGGVARFGTLSGIAGASQKAYVFTDNGGSIFASTSTAGVSDRRVKKDVASLNVGLELINQLNPVQFNWQSFELGEYPQEPHRTRLQYGLIAQELKHSLESAGLYEIISLIMPQPNQESYQENLPEEDISIEPILGIDYVQLIPILIKAIKELSARIESLETDTEG